MKIQTALSHKDFAAVPSQGFAILLSEGFTSADYAVTSEIVSVDVGAYLEYKKFKGAADSCVVLPVVHDGKTIKFFFVGLGKKDSSGIFSIETYRRALGT